MQSGDMLKILELAEQGLPLLLPKREIWTSMFVDYEEPFVERLWTPFQYEGQVYRILLHRLHVTTLSQALFHPHPWPSAMRILRGAYRMRFGVSSTEEAPPVVLEQYLKAGCTYEMAHPDGWHSVAPVTDETYTLMVTGKPWDRPSPKPPTEQRELTQWEIEGLIQTFAFHYGYRP